MKTPLKKFYRAIVQKLCILTFFGMLGTFAEPASAQICDSITPVYVVDLSSSPMASWTSPSGKRDGLCCGANSPDVCVEFIITLAPGANGISFNIASGAVPPGALYYQINCGPIVRVGQPVCLTGPGPHILTFCKPGNNNNSYQITSYPQPSVQGTQYVSQACTGQLSVMGLADTGITWTSVPYNATYNGYLNCTHNCDTVIVTSPGASAPAYVDYQVCGYVIGGCLPYYFCDTMRVHFVNDLAVTINPHNPTICFGGTPATLTANASGGLAPFSYIWSTGATTQSISVTQGTYWVTLTDAMGCNVATDTVVVNALPSPIDANAGPDILMCNPAQTSVQLNGAYVASTGAVWSHGAGSYSPNSATMNAFYTPTAGEISAGFVNLMLTTTGNSGCPADSDQVHITIGTQPSPAIAGASPVCAFSTNTYSVTQQAGVTYTWNVTGGTILGVTASSINVQWNNVATGVITLTATHSSTCDSVVTRNITIHPTPTPVIVGPATVCQYDTRIYSLQVATSNTIAWTVTGGTIVGASNATSVTVQWPTAGAGTVSVTETTGFGCDSAVSIPVTVSASPIAAISGPNTVCAYDVATYTTPSSPNTTYNWTVTGGTVLTNTGTSITIRWNAGPAGNLSLVATNTSGCDSTAAAAITIHTTPTPVIVGPGTVCQYDSRIYSLQTPSANTKTWVVSGGSIVGASNGNSITVLWNTPGPGMVSVTETTGFGCDSAVSIPVTVSASPIAAISGPNTVCAYNVATYTTPSSPNTTYNWTVTGGTVLTNTGTSITIRWNAGPAGNLSLVATNTSGCDSTAAAAITIHTTPTPVIVGPGTVCQYDSRIYSLQTPSANTIAWVVTGGSIVGASNGNSITVLWNTPGAGTVRVTETTGNGCDSSVSIPVTIGATSIAAITGPTTLCAYDVTTYTTPSSPNTTYTWTVTGGTILTNTGTSISVRWNAGPSGNISLVALNASGCDSTAAAAITIRPTPTPVITGPATVCQYDTRTYALQTPSANTINWVVTGGQVIGSATGNSVVVSWNNTGTGTVTVTETTSLGCDSTISRTVTVNPTPVPQIVGAATVCAYNTASYSTPVIANTTFSWSVSGGTILSNTGTTVSIRWNAGPAGSITLTATHSSGCDSTIVRAININPTPTPAITGPTSVCRYQSATYGLQSVSGNSVSWVVTGGQLVGSSTGNTIQVNWNVAGSGSVSVTETNSSGCDSSVSIPVTILQAPAPNITGPATVCAYDNATYTTPTSAGNTYTWSVTGGTITSNSSSTVGIHWGNGASGTVTMTATNPSGCDSIVTLPVTIRPAPTPAITGPATACTQTTSVYALQTTTSNTVSWSVTGGQILGSSAGNSIVVQWNNPGTGVVTITETSPLGCDSTVTKNVSVGQSSIPVINGPATVCAYDAASYYTPSSLNTTYTWSVTGGTVTSNNGTSIIVTWGTGPAGSITLTATNSSGCDSTVSRNITIRPTPVPVISGIASVCTYQTVMYALQNFSLNTKAWSVTGGTIVGAANGNSIQVNWTTPGNQLVTVTETNSQGCDSSATFAVAVGLTSVPQINGPNTVCAYSSSNYYTPTWVNTTYTWNVSGGTITSNTGAAITVSWNAVPTGTVTLMATNISGCDSTVQTTVRINPTPVPVILGASANCTQTTDVYSVANPTSNTFSWTVLGGTIIGPSNQTSVTVNWTTPGIGRVTVTESNSLGCDSTAFKNVQINGRPWPVLSGNPQVCETDTATYSVPYVAGDSYIWNVVGGGIVGFSVSNTIDVQWYSPGNGSVSCRQVSPTGCDSLVAMNVLINGRPNPYITGPSQACQNLNYNYSVNPTNGNLYNWSVNGGTIQNSTTDPNISVLWSNTGLGDLTLVETTPEGCANMTNTTVQINGRPAPAITGSNVGCISPNSSNYSVVNEPGVYYLWSVTGGSILSGNGTNVIDILWNTPGNHDIVVAAIDLATGCDSIMSKAIKVDSLAQIAVTAPSFIGCAPMKLTFSGNQVNSSYNYQWRFGDGGTATTANPTHSFTQPGVFSVNVFATNATGCSDSAQAVVTVNPSPTSAFTQSSTDPIFYAGTSTLTLTNQSQGAVQYNWDFGDGDNSTDFEPTYQYAKPGLYHITLVSTNAYGCSDTSNSILEVRLPEDLYVPNAFTPNGDAINDYFTVAQRNITDFRIFIYNRWGEMVYKSDNVNFAWDGTVDGQPGKMDVYVYLIKAYGYHGKAYDLKGTVTLVR